MKEIPLSQDRVAIVDDDDFEQVSKFRWHFRMVRDTGYGYGTRKEGRNKTVFIHTQIMKYGEGFVCDHINGDTLDNRRSNLRVCSIGENNRNGRKRRNGKTSKYKGVSWSTEKKMFAAYISFEWKSIFLGRYADEDEAARAYNKAATKYHGKFARLNSIPA